MICQNNREPQQKADGDEQAGHSGQQDGGFGVIHIQANMQAAWPVQVLPDGAKRRISLK